MRFKQYLRESASNMEELIKLLKDLGYADTQQKSSRVLFVKTNKDRVSVLKELEKSITGAKYDKNLSGSSVGGIQLLKNMTIYVKPLKTSGSGAGAAMTEMVESAQCVYLAAVWYGNYNFDIDTFKKLESKFDVTAKLSSISTELPEDWQEITINIAKKLHSVFKNKNYVFHRGSKWVKNLENRFKMINGKDRQFANLNKWSPADIYMISDVGLRENFEKADSFMELNAILLKHLNNRDIVPVSLKKTGDNPTIKYVNVDDNRSTYSVKDPFYVLGLRSFFDSKDVYVNYVDGRIQFRGFNIIDFQGEIKGKYASHGKVGNGDINRAIKRHSGYNMDTPREVSIRFKNNKEDLIKDFYSYYKSIERNPANYDAFFSKAIEKDMGWMISKYLGTKMVYFMEKSKKMDAIIGSMIAYASSQSDISAPFVKVS
jgi:predicted RNA binding protein YcfA (HicA-like mRNA interferase family)